MDIIGKRIRGIRTGRKMTQQEFARTLGIAQGYLSDIEHGNKIPSDTLLIALAHTYDVSTEWLTGRAAEKPQVIQKKIPLLKSVPQDLTGPMEPDEVVDFLRLPEMQGECYAVVATGNYMAPTICNGDLVVFSRKTEVANGDIAFVTNRWGQPILRRFRLRGEQVFFAPDNTLYAPFRPDDGTRILGRVESVWRNVYAAE